MNNNCNISSSPSIHEMRLSQMLGDKKSSCGYNKKDKVPLDRDEKTKKINFFEKNTQILKQEKNINFKFGKIFKNIKEISFNELDFPDLSLDDLNLFKMSSDVAHDYYVYSVKKKNKRVESCRNFSFYEFDGSINYFRVGLGIFSDDDKTQETAIRLFVHNFDSFVSSQFFLDLLSMIFALTILLYLYFSLFFNVVEFLKYSMHIFA